LLVLLVPFFIASFLIEDAIAVLLLSSLEHSRVAMGVFVGNLVSYCALAAMAAGCLVWLLRQSKSRVIDRQESVRKESSVRDDQEKLEPVFHETDLRHASILRESRSEYCEIDPAA
jgi:hypothetical protein